MKSITLPQIAVVGFIVGLIFHACVFSAVLGGSGPNPADTIIGGERPVAIATVAPTPTRLADRTSCNEIRGSDYRSATERQWFLTNC